MSIESLKTKSTSTTDPVALAKLQKNLERIIGLSKGSRDIKECVSGEVHNKPDYQVNPGFTFKP
ncbi:hypothetical protein BCT01_00770 [Vibrio tasmaniensis]|uniref:Uncharacterized protein n=1 Tax=Vibrio tasmaniensis TaxID=212663 RepID=A0A2N7ND01_9VIBR|nr:hypothetical protein BCT01_00770 [Vibrio tasmaniensis]PMP09983.1 hypothetical protein BCS92_02320 [Vibrio tasmaniensis]